MIANTEDLRPHFNAGWDASRKTRTYDLGAAVDRYAAKHGLTLSSPELDAYEVGWTTYAAGPTHSRAEHFAVHAADVEATTDDDDDDQGDEQPEAERDPLAAVEDVLHALDGSQPTYRRVLGLADRLDKFAKGRPLLALDYLTELIETAETLRAAEVDRARAAGESWQEIGAQIGTTRQAAQQRYGRPKPQQGSPEDQELPL